MGKIYLEVDYSKRSVVKKLGAKWNPQLKMWYWDSKDGEIPSEILRCRFDVESLKLKIFEKITKEKNRLNESLKEFIENKGQKYVDAFFDIHEQALSQPDEFYIANSKVLGGFGLLGYVDRSLMPLNKGKTLTQLSSYLWQPLE